MRPKSITHRLSPTRRGNRGIFLYCLWSFIFFVCFVYNLFAFLRRHTRWWKEVIQSFFDDTYLSVFAVISEQWVVPWSRDRCNKETVSETALYSGGVRRSASHHPTRRRCRTDARRNLRATQSLTDGPAPSNQRTLLIEIPDHWFDARCPSEMRIQRLWQRLAASNCNISWCSMPLATGYLQ